MTSFTTCVFLNLKTSSTLEETDLELPPSCGKFATTVFLFVRRIISIHRCWKSPLGLRKQGPKRVLGRQLSYQQVYCGVSRFCRGSISVGEDLGIKGLYECLSLALYLCMATYPARMHSSQEDKYHIILSSKEATNIVDVNGYLQTSCGQYCHPFHLPSSPTYSCTSIVPMPSIP